MQRTTKTSITTFVIALTALLGLASLGLRYQFARGGATFAAAPQGLFNNSDNFIFTNASMKGTYAGVLNCSVLSGTTTLPCAVSYLYTAGGNGNLTNTNATVNINGQTSLDIVFPGTYTVSTSGRVSMTVIPTNGPLMNVPLPVSSVVTETSGGQIIELRGVHIAPGIVSSLVEKRIRR